MKKIPYVIFIIGVITLLFLAGCGNKKVSENTITDSNNTIKNSSKTISFKEIGKEYDDISYLIEINGKLAYTAEKEGIWFIIYDGQKIGKDFSYMSGQEDYNGKLVFRAVVYKDKNSSIRDFTYDGKEIVEGLKPVYQAHYLWEKKDVIVYNGQELGREYDGAHSPVLINGKLAYVAKKNNSEFIVYDGQEIDKDKGYDWIREIVIINGKFAYVVLKKDIEYIVYDGQEIGKDKEYEQVQSPIDVNGKLAYIAQKNNTEFIVYDGQEIGKDKGLEIRFLISINGKLAYQVYKDGKYFIVYNGQDIGRGYYSAGLPVNNNGKLAYLAVENIENKVLKTFIVMEE